MYTRILANHIFENSPYGRPESGKAIVAVNPMEDTAAWMIHISGHTTTDRTTTAQYTDMTMPLQDCRHFIKHQGVPHIMDYTDSVNARIANMRPSWTVTIMEKRFVPSSVDIRKTTIPVKKPDTRGGVYFSEKEAYKATCIIYDTTITPLLTSSMLGPNTDFAPIILQASAGQARLRILANLTNYMQGPDSMKLAMIITGVTY